MDQNNNIPIGSMISYNGDVDPVGRVMCDGIARDNSVGKYNTLISLKLGEMDSALCFVPPNYKNSVITNFKDPEALRYNLLHPNKLPQMRRCHTYVLNNKVMEYNNKFYEIGDNVNPTIDLNDTLVNWIIKC